VESVLRFLRSGGTEAIVTSHELLSNTASGWAGTHIVPDNAADKITDSREELEAVVTG
jgi:hypothetical protein